MDTSTPTARRLTEVLRDRRDSIIQRWKEWVRELPVAKHLSEPRLIDHIPTLLDGIADAIDRMPADHACPPPPEQPPLRGASLHRMARLGEGFDLLEIVSELRLLRRAVLTAMGDSVRVDEVCMLGDTIDEAIDAGVARYTEIRDETLLALDRVAMAAFESTSLDELLYRLLVVFKGATPLVDTASIWLRDGDELRLRAAVGLGREIEHGRTIKIGESFAGAVASRGQAMTLEDPASSAMVGPTLATAGLRFLYGVPILDGERVIGVAKCGSRSVDQLSLEDRRLFAAMVARASAALVQHALREQVASGEREFRALADNIAQLAWMADPEGKINWFNRRWYDFTGMSFAEMVRDPWAAVAPEHHARVVAEWKRAVEAGRPWEDTFPLRSADGHYRWFLSRAVPIRRADCAIERWFGTNTDVTKRRFLDEASQILYSSLDLEATLDKIARHAVPDFADWCIVDLAEKDQLRHVAIAHADERKREQALEVARQYPVDPGTYEGGYRVLRTRAPAIEPVITSEMLDAGATTPEQAAMLHGLGFASWIGAPLVARDRALGVIHLAMAESGRHYTEADVEIAVELGRRAGVAVDNARLYGEAQVAVRQREDLLAVVSHDLRGPLGTIDLCATLLRDRVEGDPLGNRHVDMIRHSSERMSKLIDDLLDMASINAGRLSIEPTVVDAGFVVEEAIEMIEPRATERSISIVRDYRLGDARVIVDRNRIAQVFANLMGNSVKFCSPGDVITVRGVHRNDCVSYEIADTGPGIPEAELPHIFEPYWSGAAGKKKGTGLGLFITKAIVEAHGGTLTVASSEGAGATFTLTLPAADGVG